MVAIPGHQNNIDALSLTGGVMAASSLVMGLLVLFVIPGGACSFLGAIELLMLAFLFVSGIFVLLAGLIRSRQKSNFKHS